MKKIVFLLIFLISGFVNAQKINIPITYVTIDCDGNFSNNGVPFNLTSVAYIVRPYNYTTPYHPQDCNTYFVSPDVNYININSWGLITKCDGSTIWGTTFDDPIQVIKDDFAHIKSLGFNTIRLNHIMPQFDNVLNIITPTSASYAMDIDLIEDVLGIANSYGLKVILLSGATGADYDVDAYASYLELLSDRLQNHPALLAYDIANELAHLSKSFNQNDKYRIAGWVNYWTQSIKKNDTNHLVMIGLDDPMKYCATWDPEICNVDFVGHHIYPPSNTLSEAVDRYKLCIDWVNKNTIKPYIIGETGYAGNDAINHSNSTDSEYSDVGTEAEQKSYAEQIFQFSLDCNCKGVNWWQYREIEWNMPRENYFGIVKTFTPTIPRETKSIVSSLNNIFKQNKDGLLTKNSNNCSRGSLSPSLLLNSYLYSAISGNVNDITTGVGKKDVVVKLLQYYNNTYHWYYTLTDNNGNFNIKSASHNPAYQTILISYPGYSVIKKDAPSNNATYNIEPIALNQWTKIWSNDNEQTSLPTNKIDDWFVSNDDVRLVGDFNKDERDELLLLKSTPNSNDNVELMGWQDGDYNDNIDAWTNYGFKPIWRNNSNDWMGSWNLTSIGRYFSGDFNGDGQDDILSLSETSSSTDWAMVQTLHSDGYNFTPIANNHGSDWMGSWWLNSSDNILVGNFKQNVAKEILLISKATSGNWAQILKVTNGGWETVYNNNGSNMIGDWIIGSNDKFYIGDFDGCGYSELLCVQNTGSSLDKMELLSYNTTTGTFEQLWVRTGGTNNPLFVYRDNLMIGDVENYFVKNSCDEILVYSNTGSAASLLKFNFLNNSFVLDWSTSSRISDFELFRSGKNTQITFFKPYKNFSKCMLTNSYDNSNYDLDLYMFNPKYNCTSTLRSLTKAPIENNHDFDIKIYPNPAKDFINIESSSNLIDKVQIFDIQGRSVFEKNNVHTYNYYVDMSIISNGLYAIKINYNGKQFNKKIIIMK